MKMTTVEITIDDSLPLSKLRTVLSLIRGVTRIEIAESHYVDTEKKEYEQLKTAFLNGSRHSMAQQINKYLS
jgi:hypothetical protein